ncbi:helix-turn-helix domain-containing protein [Deinococcus wulumuqiensis]|uniref:helix-turn-helix domain-containing protein n=1 Tax=Deinococcus wulumuqiensis TaxID=980427 RepID=UPI001CEF6878|nr:helix-turn-helix domain-containing protein [Deinococcus wulumuqiensis]
MQNDTTIRVYRFRLYPTKPQEAAMFETLRLTRTLYNAGLEQRIAAYRKQGKTVTAYDQQKELSALKAECPSTPGSTATSCKMHWTGSTRRTRAFSPA